SAFIDEALANGSGDAGLAAAASTEIATSRVLTPDFPLVDGPAATAFAQHAATIERARSTGGLSPWNGLIDAPALTARLREQFGDAHVWSASRLEAYAKCPWAFFSGRLLRLDKLEDPDPDIDPRDRGTLLHEALRHFFDAAAKRAGSPVFLRRKDLDWVEPLVDQALDRALAAGTEFWLGPPHLREVRIAELRRRMRAFVKNE